MRALLVLIAGLLATVQVQAQSDTAAIPRELATALVSTADYSSSRARIVVGTFPTPAMARLVPRGGRVLGGLVHEDRRGNANRFTGLLVFTESPDSVATLFEERLIRAGWEAPAMNGFGSQMGGFVSAGSGSGTGRERPLMFCSDSAATTAQLIEYASGSLLRLTLSNTTRNSICDRDHTAAPQSRMMMERIEMPTLRPPTGSSGNGRGTGSSMDRADATAHYSSSRNAQEMLAYFGPQLSEQGWTVEKRVGDEDAGLLTGRKTVKGETHFLLITDHMMASRQHELSMSVRVPSRRP